MKKKVLYGVFMACFAFTAVGTLQSCKDDLSEFEHQTNYNFAQMESVIAGLKSDLAACKESCNARLNDLQRQIAENAANDEKTNERIDALNDKLRDYVTITMLNQRLSDLESSLKSYSDEGDAALDRKIGAINAAISQLSESVQNQLNSLDGKIDKLGETLGGRIDGIDYKIGVLEGKIAANTASIETIKSTLETLEGKVSGLDTKLTGIVTRLETLEGEYKTLSQQYSDILSKYNDLASKYSDLSGKYDDLTGKYNDLSGKYNDLKSDVDALAGEISGIDSRLSTLETEFDALTKRIDDMLTSILVQGVDSPLFGNFSLPLGIKSNLVFDWFGTFDNPVDFPSPYAETAFDAVGIKGLKADFDRVGAPSMGIPAGYVVNPTLGTVYVTLNPIGHNLTQGKTFSLETSAGKRLPIALNVEESDHEIYFGYSRSAANGFYSAQVAVENTPEQLDPITITIDENLKTSAKNLFNDFSKHNAYDLLKAVYHQLDGMLPAYALRADWSSLDAKGNWNNYAVVSDYGMAVATAKPLSYKFFYGESINKSLPTHGHIDNIINDLKNDLSFTLNTSFDIDNNFKVNFAGFDLKINTTVSVDRKSITITIPSINVLDNAGNKVGKTEEKKVEIPASDLEGLYSAIEKGFNDAIKNLSNDLNNQINAQIREKLISQIEEQVSEMLTNIEKQVNKMLKDLEGQINSQISDMIDNMAGKVEPFFTRVNQMIDIYNKVATKINNFLANPNHYLQVAAFYVGGGSGSAGLVSNVKSDPTPFKRAGGDAIILYLSSYSGEIVCPAYKKYAAVTNIYNAQGASVADNATLKRINDAGVNLNKVFDGHEIKVALPSTLMTPGYTYEIVYQGLDYFGATSTQKFYIKVN